MKYHHILHDLLDQLEWCPLVSDECLNHEWSMELPVNTWRPRQNGRHFPDGIFKWIFLNENVWISINISLKFVPRGPINNIPTLVQVMAWRRPGDKPLSESMMVRLPTHICITRPQWVNTLHAKFFRGNKNIHFILYHYSTLICIVVVY